MAKIYLQNQKLYSTPSTIVDVQDDSIQHHNENLYHKKNIQEQKVQIDLKELLVF